MRRRLLLLQIVYLLINLSRGEFDYSYHDYATFTAQLKAYSVRFPTKTYLYSIGKSVQGRDLWVMAIADSQPEAHLILRPEAKYIGNMHGNEVPSKEILLHLIDYLLLNQTTDPTVDYLLKNTRIHILPSLNPDGNSKQYDNHFKYLPQLWF
jgi:murein tripeptide amidase MpaA